MYKIYLKDIENNDLLWHITPRYKDWVETTMIYPHNWNRENVPIYMKKVIWKYIEPLITGYDYLANTLTLHTDTEENKEKIILFCSCYS